MRFRWSHVVFTAFVSLALGDACSSAAPRDDDGPGSGGDRVGGASAGRGGREPEGRGGTAAGGAWGGAAGGASGGAAGGASAGASGAGGAAGGGGASPLTGRLAPAAGKTLLIVGQDLGSVRGYACNVWDAPGGVTTYTDLSEKANGGPMLVGLRTLANYGAGDLHAAAALSTYPGSALSIGLYLVDHTGSNLDHLADGTHDDAIDDLGAFIKDAGRPVFLRIGYEFDGEWNHYEPEKYKKAFRHIVTRLRSRGVDGFASVWQSATYAQGTYRGLPIDAWYPGDDVVDWAGSSYFKFATAPHAKLLAFARQHRKPVLIAEASPQGYELDGLTFSDDGKAFAKRSADQIWNEWFAPFFRFIEDNADVVRAVAYINADWASQPMWGPSGGNGYWGDARVEANAAIEQRWLTEIKKPLWQHGSAARARACDAATPGP